MVVGVLRLGLLFGECQSLKDKRNHLRRLIQRVRSKFNVAIAEVGFLDQWQRSVVGIVVTSNEQKHVNTMIEHVVTHVETNNLAQVVGREVDYVFYDTTETLFQFDKHVAGYDFPEFHD